mmetsp:Transcript_2095/g.5152  ORF Transcript_2095/g.5152 Transcript_2095/m.5152 type:complete len:428 (-) Transcript_2095:595-1878(-)
MPGSLLAEVDRVPLPREEPPDPAVPRGGDGPRDGLPGSRSDQPDGIVRGSGHDKPRRQGRRRAQKYRLRHPGLEHPHGRESHRGNYRRRDHALRGSPRRSHRPPQGHGIRLGLHRHGRRGLPAHAQRGHVVRHLHPRGHRRILPHHAPGLHHGLPTGSDARPHRDGSLHRPLHDESVLRPGRVHDHRHRRGIQLRQHRNGQGWRRPRHRARRHLLRILVDLPVPQASQAEGNTRGEQYLYHRVQTDRRHDEARFQGIQGPEMVHDRPVVLPRGRSGNSPRHRSDLLDGLREDECRGDRRGVVGHALLQYPGGVRFQENVRSHESPQLLQVRRGHVRSREWPHRHYGHGIDPKGQVPHELLRRSHRDRVRVDVPQPAHAGRGPHPQGTGDRDHGTHLLLRTDRGMAPRLRVHGHEPERREHEVGTRER